MAQKRAIIRLSWVNNSKKWRFTTDKIGLNTDPNRPYQCMGRK
jgi:hypothetical protein